MAIRQRIENRLHETDMQTFAIGATLGVIIGVAGALGLEHAAEIFKNPGIQTLAGFIGEAAGMGAGIKLGHIDPSMVAQTAPVEIDG